MNVSASLLPGNIPCNVTSLSLDRIICQIGTTLPRGTIQAIVSYNGGSAGPTSIAVAVDNSAEECDPANRPQINTTTGNFNIICIGGVWVITQDVVITKIQSTTIIYIQGTYLLAFFVSFCLNNTNLPYRRSCEFLEREQPNARRFHHCGWLCFAGWNTHCSDHFIIAIATTVYKRNNIDFK